MTSMRSFFHHFLPFSSVQCRLTFFQLFNPEARPISKSVQAATALETDPVAVLLELINPQYDLYTDLDAILHTHL